MSGQHVWGTAPDFIGPRHELRETLLLQAFLGAVPGPRVLNVGAGQGTFTNRLTRRGFEVVSTEFGEPAVSALRNRVDGVVLEADATALPLATASFDAIVLGEVLEHIDDDELALREAGRVLMDGGVVSLSVPRNPNWFSSSDRWAGHVRRYTREELTARVETAGFRILTCSAWGFPISSLYHRTIYERAIRRHPPEQSLKPNRRAAAVLAVLLRLDRLFIGVERGALGYVLVARKKDERPGA